MPPPETVRMVCRGRAGLYELHHTMSCDSTRPLACGRSSRQRDGVSIRRSTDFFGGTARLQRRSLLAGALIQRAPGRVSIFRSRRLRPALCHARVAGTVGKKAHPKGCRYRLHTENSPLSWRVIRTSVVEFDSMVTRRRMRRSTSAGSHRRRRSTRASDRGPAARPLRGSVAAARRGARR